MITPPRRRWTKSQRPDTGPVYLTPEGIAKLKARLTRLKRDLPKYIEESARTAEYGDRSDNAEYKEAKGQLRRTQGQIWAIEDQLKRIVEIPSGSVDGIVQVGCTVVLEMMNGKKATKTFRILGPSETDPVKGFISHLSPLGAALIGHSKGDTVTVTTPAGSQTYTIADVR